VQTILTFLLLFVSRGLNVSHPLILKFAVDDITCNSEHQSGGGDCPHTAEYTYLLVAMYAVIRFLADFVNNIREIPFANVSASAEIYIAHLVYSHTQNQSLAYHLSRETGKVVRIVSRGSQSFAQILRIALFNILPLIIELILVLAIIFTLYPVVFFLVTCGSVVIYVWATVVLTEWRAKYFKSLANKDAEYS
jgi:ATP-binding cassette subfamily B protein